MCRSIFGISFNRGRTTIGILDIIIRGEPEKQTAADDSEVCIYDRCNTIVPYRPRSTARYTLNQLCFDSAGEFGIIVHMVRSHEVHRWQIELYVSIVLTSISRLSWDESPRIFVP